MMNRRIGCFGEPAGAALVNSVPGVALASLILVYDVQVERRKGRPPDFTMWVTGA
jgi:hypothetical protein